MANDYFTRLKERTGTRLWINNPIMPEIDKALAHGAVSCTTNPAYSAKMLQRDADVALSAVDDCLNASDDDNVVADLVQQKLASRVLERFLPTYQASQGRDGFVSIQGNPYTDTNVEHIVEEIRNYRKLSPNVIAKIPATSAGLKAIKVLIAEDTATVITEVFGLPQMIYACEVYRKVSQESGKHPPCYITHVTGIFDEHLQEYAQGKGIDIAPEVLGQAGLAVARKQYHLFKERGYEGIILGGGARGTHHFTDLVGGEMHITINWSTAEEILKLDLPIEDRIDIQTSQKVIDELLDKIPAFRGAWLEDGLDVAEFAGYGPVQHFRNQFISGWDQLLAIIKQRREIS